MGRTHDSEPAGNVIDFGIMRTLFFDIDGTLLVSHGAGSIALRRAVEIEFGLSDFSAEDIEFGGRTDVDLVGQILTVCELPNTPENSGRLRRSYSGLLRQSLREVGGNVLPGVFQLLQTLTPMEHLNLAVLTGNYPETARMKLEAFDLMDFFNWVVGGDLDLHRNDMARRALQLLQRQHPNADDVMVIGDTVNDVRCAHAIGAKCLAVCTGSGARRDLEKAGADKIVETLEDASVLSFLGD